MICACRPCCQPFVSELSETSGGFSGQMSGRWKNASAILPGL